MHQPVTDIFKKYKLQESKQNQEKKGNVKWTHEKCLGRKVLALEGIVGSSNYLKFPLEKSNTIRQRYVYIQCCSESGHTFSIILTINLNGRQFKLILNSLSKQHKKLNNQYTIPIDIVSNRWSIVVVDMWTIVEDLLSNKEKQVLLELVQIQLRATLKLKGMFSSNVFYQVNDLPKDLSLPLHNGQLFYQNYRYYLINKSDETIQMSCISKGPISKLEKQKSQTKILQQQSIQNKTLSSAKSISRIKQTPKASKILMPTKDKQLQQKQALKYTEQLELPQPQPKPLATIQCSLQFQQGATLSIGEIRSIEQCLITPDIIYTHKPIRLFKKISDFVIIVAYNDATIAYFHLLSKNPIKYFQTELEIITGFEIDFQGILVVWGLDKLRRWVLMLIEQQSILFRQISNYEITGLLLLGKSFKQGILTFGKQSLRIWSIKKDMIVGSNLYLGEFARNTQFVSGIIAQGKALITSSIGNLFTIKLETSEVQTIQKLQSECIDHIQKLPPNKLITASESGILKVYNSVYQTLFQTNLHCRIKYLSIKGNNQVILNHYDGTTGKLLLSEGKYQFLYRCHQGPIIDVKYHPRCKRLISISQDATIRIWRMIKGGQDIEQEYQFQVHSEGMTSLALYQQYSFLVGFQSGVIRKFDLKQLKMVEEKQHNQSSVSHIQVSKGDRYVLVADIGGCVFLLDQSLNILSKYQIEPQQKPCIGFNSKSLSFYISTRKLQLSIFSLKSQQRVISIQLQSSPQQIYFDDDLMHVLTSEAHIIYRSNKFVKMTKLPKHQATSVQLPLFAVATGNSLYIGVDASLHSRQEMFIPETLSGLVFSRDEQQLLFGWGSKSYTIYGWRLQTRNLPLCFDYSEYQQEQQNQNSQKPQVIIKNIPIQSPKPQMIQTIPRELKPLYPSYQSFFPPENPHQNQFISQVIEQQPEYSNSIIKCENISTELVIGWNYQSPLHNIIWNRTERYLVYSSGNDLIVQYFEQKVRQQIIKLAFKPEKLHGSKKYFSFSVGTTLWLYNSDNTKFYKSIVMEGQKIIDYSFSNCESYLVVLLMIKGKVVIAVLDILTGKVIVSSYSESSSEIVLLNVNQFRDKLQFNIIRANKLSFYRITSIQTLQTQQLDLQSAITKTGNILCSKYVKIGKDELILLGTINGSIIVIDSRGGVISLLCISVVKSPIIQILYMKQSLVILTNSVNIYIWKDLVDIGQIAERVAEKVQNVVTLDSGPVALSQFCDEQSDKMIVISRLGVQWLLDTEDLMTIKLMSVHTKPITCCQYIDGKIVTGSEDGTIKITNSTNLQVEIQFYKPKKVVHSLLYIRQLNMLVSCHGNTLCFYQGNLVLGSCQLESPAIGLKYIYSTRNILVGTRKQVLMIYLAEQNPFRIQIERIADFPALNSLQINQLNHFNVWLCCSASGKTNVWTRKCLKRYSDPVQQLSNVHGVQYYLVDNFQPSNKLEPSYCKFSSMNTYICVHDGKLFERNFSQHLVLREVSVGICSCIQVFDDKIIVGDGEGSVSIVDKHGMIVQKMRVLQSVKGLIVSGRNLLVYGNKVAKCIIC